MWKPSKGSVDVADISQRVVQTVHSSSALPPSPRATHLQDFLRVLRENHGNKSEVVPLLGTILKQSETLLFPSSVTMSLMKTELVQTGAYPTEARVRSSFAACGAHSVLGSLLQWFSESILMLFTCGLESVASFPEEWDARLQKERANMSSLHQYIFELQGFGILFSYLWCRLAMVASLSQTSTNATNSREELEGLPFLHENTNSTFFKSNQTGHDKSRSSHQETQKMRKASHMAYLSTQLTVMDKPLENEASNKAAAAFLPPMTSSEQNEVVEGASSALGVKLEAVGRSSGPSVSQTPGCSQTNLLKKSQNLVSLGSRVNKLRGATDPSNVVQPATSSANLSEALIKGHGFTTLSQSKNPAPKVRMPSFAKCLTNSPNIERDILITKTCDHVPTQLPYNEDAPIELTSCRCSVLPPKSVANKSRGGSWFPKSNSSSMPIFRLDEAEQNSTITPTIDPMLMKKQGELRSISIEDFARNERKKALKKLYGVTEIRNFAHERDTKDYIRHMDELRDLIENEGTNNTEEAN
ncbi:unnamed protein product [Phytomonas sp. Hart1]|nr:unnamed protein product [Phytomonas sp. Hart1]|eukprot:CCW69222.1 unnamed protein product [Phytomonas sp. isolate Hart1]